MPTLAFIFARTLKNAPAILKCFLLVQATPRSNRCTLESPGCRPGTILSNNLASVMSACLWRLRVSSPSCYKCSCRLPCPASANSPPTECYGPDCIFLANCQKFKLRAILTHRNSHHSSGEVGLKRSRVCFPLVLPPSHISENKPENANAATYLLSLSCDFSSISRNESSDVSIINYSSVVKSSPFFIDQSSTAEE